jgi:hypothetical protein
MAWLHGCFGRAIEGVPGEGGKIFLAEILGIRL